MKIKTKQPTRIGIGEMDNTEGEFSGEGKGRNKGAKVQGRSSIISRHKIDGER